MPGQGAWAQEAVRRGLEMAVSAVALVLFSPVFGAIALLIWLDSGLPIFYRGYRVGRGSRTFRMIKFRTLPNGTEGKVGSRLIKPEEEREATPLGQLLRETKLDELPQLVNVLAGQMSLVGPRANRPSYYQEWSQHIPGYRFRTLVKPGMTGLAQVFGDYYTPPHAKLRYDRLYILRRSLRLDLWLVMLTIGRLAGGKRLIRGRVRARRPLPTPATWPPGLEEIPAR